MLQEPIRPCIPGPSAQTNCSLCESPNFKDGVRNTSPHSLPLPQSALVGSFLPLERTNGNRSKLKRTRNVVTCLSTMPWLPEIFIAHYVSLQFHCEIKLAVLFAKRSWPLGRLVKFPLNLFVRAISLLEDVSGSKVVRDTFLECTFNGLIAENALTRTSVLFAACIDRLLSRSNMKGAV